MHGPLLWLNLHIWQPSFCYSIIPVFFFCVNLSTSEVEKNKRSSGVCLCIFFQIVYFLHLGVPQGFCFRHAMERDNIYIYIYSYYIFLSKVPIAESQTTETCVMFSPTLDFTNALLKPPFSADSRNFSQDGLFQDSTSHT